MRDATQSRPADALQCPVWCVDHYDTDDEPQYCGDYVDLPGDLSVHLDQFDDHPVQVFIRLSEYDEGPFVPLTVVRRLASALTELADIAEGVTR